MRVVSFFLAMGLVLFGSQAGAQCPTPVVTYYGGPYYGGYAAYGPGTYAGYATYAPFRARQPSYPAFSTAPPVARYGTAGYGGGAQTTYFRGASGPFAPPGGTFFGGYDYQVSYPPDWYGGYWTWW